MNYFTTCKHCGERDSRLRPVYVYRKSGDRTTLKGEANLESDGLHVAVFMGKPPESGDEVELSCSFCGARSNLDEYAIPDHEKIAAPDIEALRRDINSMLDTARFAPRPPVFEPKPKTKPCKACDSECSCDTREEAPEDGYCECSGCDGCDSCRCCCGCNNDEDEPTGDDEPDFDRNENDIRQREVREMEGNTRWESLRDRIAGKLETEVPENSFYIICDWENWNHQISTDAYRTAEKFLNRETSEAEVFVQSPRNDFKVLVASWHERVLHIERE